MGSNPLQRAKIKFILLGGLYFFVFYNRRGFEKHGFPDKENCNLAGNGCKVRGRVGGVDAERILVSRAKIKFILLGGLYFFIFLKIRTPQDISLQ